MNLETSLLAKLPDNPAAINQCWEAGLREVVFETPVLKSVFTFIIDYWLANSMNTAPTKAIIAYEFESVVLEASDESITWLIESLQKRYRVNQTQQLTLMAATLSNDDPEEALNTLFLESSRIKENLAPRHSRVDMATNIEFRRARYLEKQENGLTGITFGLSELDAITSGILPGELAAVAGYAKTGKTFFLSKAGVEALKQRKKVLLITLEMPTDEIEERVDAMYSGVSYDHIQKGTLTMEEAVLLREKQDEMAALGSFHIEQPAVGERTPQHIVNRARQLGADFLIIDQLSFMESSDTQRKFNSEGDVHSHIIFDLKNEIGRADAGKMPCLLAVQFNRESVSTKGVRGKIHQLANTSNLERTVDIAYGLYQDEEMRANKSMVLDILGARRGDKASFLLGWKLVNETEIFIRERIIE